jgi:hypothetical protein
MNALLKVALFAEPARPRAQAQCFVEALEKQLLLELKRNLSRTDFHPPTVEQKRSFVTIENLLKLLRRGCVWWATEARAVVWTAELALETDPGRRHDGPRVNEFGFDSTEFLGSLDYGLNIDGLGHVGCALVLSSDSQDLRGKILDFRESIIFSACYCRPGPGSCQELRLAVHCTRNTRPVLAEYSHLLKPSPGFRFPGNHPKGLRILYGCSSNGCIIRPGQCQH